MKITAFLTISNRGSLKVTKTKPGLRSNEICTRLNIDVPNSLFERLVPTVNIELPHDSVVNPNSEVVLNITAQEVADKLSLSVVDVYDGLAEMVREKSNAEPQS